MDNQDYIVLRNTKKEDEYSAAHDLDNKVDELQEKLDAKDKELEALRGFAQDYLDDLINDCSYRDAAKEAGFQAYIDRLKAILTADK